MAKRGTVLLVPGQRSGDEAPVLPGFEALPAAGPTPLQRAVEAWETLVPLLAARPEVRLRARGGYTTRAADSRTAPADKHPGHVAAAMYLYRQGVGGKYFGRLLVFDFDTKKHTREQAEADARALVELLTSRSGRVRARVIVDYCRTTGGWHVILPLSRYVPAEDLQQLFEAIHARITGPKWNRTLDPSPMRNQPQGLLRPPGAAHHKGGFQELLVPLAEAEHVARHGNPAAVWDALHEEFAAELEARAEAERADAEQSEAIHQAAGWIDAAGNRVLSPAMRDIARFARWSRERYASISHARAALLVHMVATGWTLAEVVAGMTKNGPLPALPYLLTHSGGRRVRSPQKAEAFLIKEWESAVEHVAASAKKPTPTSEGGNSGQQWTQDRPVITGEGWTTHPALIRHGSQAGHLVHELSGTAVYHYLRDVDTAIQLLLPTRYRGTAMRCLLKGLLAMCALRGEAAPAVGVRALSLASGPGRTTVADLLNQLYAEPDPLVELVQRGSGTEADHVRLRIPDEIAELVTWRRWRPGFFVPVHPLLQYLGTAAAVAYDALSPDFSPRWELELRSALPERTLRRSLDQLVDHGLAERRGLFWRRVATPDQTKINCDAAMINFRERVAEYQAERLDWHLHLGEVPDQLTTAYVLEAFERSTAPDPDAPPTDADPAPVLIDPAPVPTPPVPTAAADPLEPPADQPDEDDRYADDPPTPPPWMAEALPPWLACPLNAYDPDFVPPPGPPDDLPPWPDHLDPAQEAALAALLDSDAARTPVDAYPDPEWIPLTRTGRRIPATPLDWAAAAAALGISERAARALRPGGRRFSDREVARLRRERPAWLGDDAEARAEAERRARRTAQRAKVQQARREEWAAALDVPEHRLPAKLPPYSPSAEADVRRAVK